MADRGSFQVRRRTEELARRGLRHQQPQVTVCTASAAHVLRVCLYLLLFVCGVCCTVARTRACCCCHLCVCAAAAAAGVWAPRSCMNRCTRESDRRKREELAGAEKSDELAVDPQAHARLDRHVRADLAQGLAALAGRGDSGCSHGGRSTFATWTAPLCIMTHTDSQRLPGSGLPTLRP